MEIGKREIRRESADKIKEQDQQIKEQKSQIERLTNRLAVNSAHLLLEGQRSDLSAISISDLTVSHRGQQ